MKKRNGKRQTWNGTRQESDFLRAVGFKNIKDQKELDELLQSIVSSPTNYMSARDSEGNEYAEFTKEFADSMGIIVRGEFTDHDNFRIEYYIPYFYGHGITSQEQTEVQKHAEKESYAGVCDELNIGVTMIFYLQNVADYLAETNSRFSAVHYGDRKSVV